MSSDYSAIRGENVTRYGTDIGRIGRMLLSDRYDERTHFIFELLQNAEDALGRREGWLGSRAVTFALEANRLRVAHFGRPFDERDVRGISGIAEGTKETDLTSIGRFGIGFKSVYAFTDRPEVHSGDEDFAIESFVWPTEAIPVDRRDDETVFILPLRADDSGAYAEISKGLRALGPRTLLFLRQIEEIKWTVDDGREGFYVRDKPEQLDDGVRRVVLIGEEQGGLEVDETWLVFSREARTAEGMLAGHVEVAFSTPASPDGTEPSIQRIANSPLVVFFPTVVQTHLGFLVQGPYRTTPSRDNVPRSDPWNQHLVTQTSDLLLAALRWLRDRAELDVATLRTLPLNPEIFGTAGMFAPAFLAVRDALKTEPLLPTFTGGYIAAVEARLGRTQDLRELFEPDQLGKLLGHEDDLVWLSETITQDRTPELRQYLMAELGIAEITPETMIARLSRDFLSAQSDVWIERLYEFLHGQQASLLQSRFAAVPLVRLEDGTHVAFRADGQPQAFLPGPVATSFPTVRRSVCASERAVAFLRALGLTQPDPVDDVIRNVLPVYQRDEVDVPTSQYEKDVERFVTAFATDSKVQREKLVAALGKSKVIAAIDAGDRTRRFVLPSDAYIATERLKELFAGVDGVQLVDDSHTCLRGEAVRELLEACGASRYLEPLSVDPTFSYAERYEMRRAGGCESSSRGETIEDRTLRGLKELLAHLPHFDHDDRLKKARLLWEALGDVEDRRGANIFSGTYRWFYHHQRSYRFDAAFVRQLNKTAWITDDLGDLRAPAYVPFEALGWEANQFLLSKIQFKPAIIDILAQEAGIEPGVLELLARLGVTSVAELTARLGLDEEPEAQEAPRPDESADVHPRRVGVGTQRAVSANQDNFGHRRGSGNGDYREAAGSTDERREQRAANGGTDTHAAGDAPPHGHAAANGQGVSGGESASGDAERTFISYVAVHSEDEADPDGLDQHARMALEARAISFILKEEPHLQRTPAGNPGFDLIATDDQGVAVRWVEVKAMAGGLHNRPVGMSQAQLEAARKHGPAYWLYVVEHAGSDTPRVVRIQNPWGEARTFTFDKGWLNIGLLGSEHEPGNSTELQDDASA